MNDRIANIIIGEARQTGIDPAIALDIARLESGLNPLAVGDKGTSFGLFQLHRGGLAPPNMSEAQLKDPAVNADIAIRHMKKAYDAGRNKGLSGYDLTAYVANTSGWPGQLGVEWTEKNRPDYGRMLRRIYSDNSTEQYIAGYDGTGGINGDTAGEIGAINDAANGGSAYDDDTNQSVPARVFRSMAEGEQFESWSEWASDAAWYEKIVPLNYIASNARPFGVRLLIVTIGLLFVLFAIFTIVKQNNPMIPAPAPVPGGVPGETPLEGEGGTAL